MKSTTVDFNSSARCWTY